jgi:predicted nucleic acid-binding protein
MISGIAVFDASPLIAFRQIEQVDLLRDLFREILVPTVVAKEVAPSLGTLPNWIHVEGEFPSPAWPRKLDAGERAAIALAVHVCADVVVLDDLAGRTVAAELGLAAVGSFGLLVRAKQSGLIGEVRPLMEAMIAHGNFASAELYRRILSLASEAE